MAHLVTLDWRCDPCDTAVLAVASHRDDPQQCSGCGGLMHISWEGGVAPRTDVFGSAKRFDCVDGEFTSSRQLQATMRKLGYEHAGDPVGGVRKDHRIKHTSYSYAGQSNRRSTAERAG